MVVLKIPEILEGLITSLVFLVIYIPASILINRSTKRSNERTRKSNARVIGQLKRNQETTKQAIRSYHNLAAKINRQNQLKEYEKWNMRLLPSPGHKAAGEGSSRGLYKRLQQGTGYFRKGKSRRPGRRREGGIGGMTEFCSCGSLIVRGNCTRKGCKLHRPSLVDPATYAQVEFIKTLLEQTNDDREVDFEILTKPEASRLIDELLEKKETGVSE